LIMKKLKVAILYYSSTGVNYQLAQWATEAAQSAETEVRRLKFRETAPQQAIEGNDAWKAFHNSEENKRETEASLDDLEWADVLIFSVPTRYGSVPSQVQSFIDTTGGLWFEGKLANKVVTAMTSAQNVHGGQETTLLSIYKTMMHWGAIPVAPGYTFQESFEVGGNPYGTSTQTDGTGKVLDDVKPGVEKQVKRAIEVAGWLQHGRNA